MGLLSGLVLAIIFIGVSTLGLLIFVYKDGKKRDVKNLWVWLVLLFIFCLKFPISIGILGLYLFKTDRAKLGVSLMIIGIVFLIIDGVVSSIIVNG